MVSVLNTTGNPITREERLKINQNWDTIVLGFSKLELKIKAITGNEDIMDLLQQLQDGVNLIPQMQAALNNSLVATSNANTATNLANQAIAQMNNSLVDANTAIARLNASNLQADTLLAELTTALTDVTDAINAANFAASLIAGWEQKFEWVSTTHYKKNNLVTYNFSSWQAKRDNTAVIPVEGDDWLLFAKKGTDGTGSVSSVNGIFPDSGGNVVIDIGQSQALMDHVSNETPQKHLEIFTAKPADFDGVGFARTKKADDVPVKADVINYVDFAEDGGTAKEFHPKSNTEAIYDYNLQKWLNEIIEDVDKDVDALKTNQLYNSALDNMNFSPQQLLYFYRALLKGKVRIAFWGDSITEGIDIDSPHDSYYNKFVRRMETLFPSVEFTFMNYSIASTGISNALSDTFIADNTSPQPANTYWRPWAKEGQSWKAAVLEFNPDLTFVAFGMNDLGFGCNTSNFFYERLSLFNEMYSAMSSSDIILVNNMLPTANRPDLYSIRLANGLAEATRVWAKSNNTPLIDANRLSNILINGNDTQNTTLGDVTSARDINIKVVSTLNDIDITKANVIVYRNNENNCFFRFDLHTNDGTNTVARLLFVDGATETILQEETFAGAVGTAMNVDISAIAGTHVVTIDGVERINVTSGLGLYEGTSLFLNWGTGTFTDKEEQFFVPMHTDIIYTEKELLANDINHPTALGHDLIYYNAFNQFFDNVVNIKKVPAKITVDGWLAADSNFTPPVGKKIYYKTFDMIYRQENGAVLEYNNQNLVLRRSELTEQLKDGEFLMRDWLTDQKIIFIAIPIGQTPVAAQLSYYII